MMGINGSIFYKKPVRFGLAIIAILTAVFIVIYLQQPLPDKWNDVYGNLAVIIPAVLTSILSLLVWRSFAPGDRPRSIWLMFGLAWVCWSLAEIIWFIIWLEVGDVPATSLADVFWLAALPFFAAAFVLQFRVIYYFSRREALTWVVLIFVAILFIAVLLTELIRPWSLLPVQEARRETFFSVFYVLSDLAMMLAALRLGHLFGRGLWGRAWLGLLVFVISDGLYTYAAMSGLYIQSQGTGNSLSLLVDTTYALAYMLMALVCYTQYLLVRHGPTMQPRVES